MFSSCATKLIIVTTLVSSLSTAQTNLRSQTARNGIIETDAGGETHSDVQNYTLQARADFVPHLPGLKAPFQSNHFSGYLKAGGSREIFYWYVESEGNPETDPVMFWTNGGPGCSGLMGFGTEFGPLLFGPQGTDIKYNPYTWNKAASILYVEQPAGVGFSFCGNPEECQDVTDEEAAQASYNMILEFFKRFPERAENDFFISSESFGGHYIPHLATTILDQNSDGTINFKGFLVGNPYVDPPSNDEAQFATIYSHGLISLPVYQNMKRFCGIDMGDKKTCNKLRNNIMDSLHRIDPYALDYPVCEEPKISISENAGKTQKDLHTHGLSAQSARLLSQIYGLNFSQKGELKNNPSFLPEQDQFDPCRVKHFTEYLNQVDVRQALHVKEKHAPKKWSLCASDSRFTFNLGDNLKSQIYLYEDLIHRAKTENKNLKMMVYSGDDDSVCALMGTQYWIYDIGAETIENRLWRPWEVNGQVAGYLTQFDLGEKTNSTLLLATVHGAGHEVPMYRPEEALKMLTSFFNDDWPLLKTVSVE